MSTNINDRFRKLREVLDVSQEVFGKIIGISKSGVSDIENKRRNVTEQHIKFLVLEHNINEDWIRTGQGEMFVEPDTFSLDEFVKRKGMSDLELDIMKCYFELDQEIRQAVVNHFKERLLNNNSEIAATTDEVPEEDPIEKEVNAYRLELEAEQKGEISSALEDTEKKAN